MPEKLDIIDRERLTALLDKVQEDEDDYRYDDEKKSMFAIKTLIRLLLQWELPAAWARLEDVKKQLCDEDIQDWLEKAMQEVNKRSLHDMITNLSLNNEMYKKDIAALQAELEASRQSHVEQNAHFLKVSRERAQFEMQCEVQKELVNALKHRCTNLEEIATASNRRIEELVAQGDQKHADNLKLKEQIKGLEVQIHDLLPGNELRRPR